MNLKDYNNMKLLEQYVFIENNKIIFNLEELFILFKIQNYNFFEQTSYFFNSEEEVIEIPIMFFPSNLDKSIEMVEKTEIDLFKETIIELSEYINKKEEYLIIKNNIEKYNNFLKEKDVYLNKIKNNIIVNFLNILDNTIINNTKLINILNNFENNEIKDSISFIYNYDNKDINNFFKHYYNIMNYIYSIEVNEDNNQIKEIIDEDLLKKKKVFLIKDKWIISIPKKMERIKINNIDNF